MEKEYFSKGKGTNGGKKSNLNNFVPKMEINKCSKDFAADVNRSAADSVETFSNSICCQGFSDEMLSLTHDHTEPFQSEENQERFDYLRAEKETGINEIGGLEYPADGSNFVDNYSSSMTAVADGKDFQCAICYKSFRKVKYLRKHCLVHEEGKRHQCEFCGKGFRWKRNLNIHYYVHGADKPHSCTMCNKSFTDKSQLRAHYRMHWNEKPFQCNKCSKCFTKRSALNKHSRVHKPLQQLYRCMKCNKRFSTSSSLRVHHKNSLCESPLSVHNHEDAKETFPCPKDGESLSEHSEAKRELFINDESALEHRIEEMMKDDCIDPLSSYNTVVIKDECEKRIEGLSHGPTKEPFKYEKDSGSLSYVREHPEIEKEPHTKGESATHHPAGEIRDGELASNNSLSTYNPEVVEGDCFQCEKCGKSFRTLKYLRKHSRVHEEVKRHTCEFCGQSFRWKKNLNVHYYVHSESKPFPCLVCNKGFTSDSQLRIHLRVHTQEKPFKCEKCDRCFSEKSSLTKHYRVHTKEKPFQCEQCNKRFSLSSSLRKHELVHEDGKGYQCEFCEKSFKRKYNLDAHVYVHMAAEKPYMCDVCNKSYVFKYQLVVHYRTHTNEKPFQCEECNKSFSQKKCLTRHQCMHTKKTPFHCAICNKYLSTSSGLSRHIRIHEDKK